MADIPADVFQYSIQSQINNMRHSNKVTRDIIALLNEADAEILTKLEKWGDSGRFTPSRLRALLKEIRAMVSESYAGAHEQIRGDMAAFADHVAVDTASMIATQAPIAYNVVRATTEQLAAIVDTAPVTVGPDKKLLLEEVFESLAAGKEEAIRGAIRLGMVEGDSTQELVRRLRGTKAAQFQDGVLEASRRHCEAICRTVVNHTSNQAMQATYKANDAVVKAWIYTSTLDGRTSITCRSLSGSRWPVGQGPIPPNHPNCLPGDSLVTPVGRITAVSKRWYDGNVVIIKTASGKTFTATPNHPILTPSGWVAVGSLNVGSDVISYGGAKTTSPNINGDHKQIPSRIEDVAESFISHSEVLSVPVPSSPEHFHGDGAGSEVAIIGANRKLWLSRDTSFREHVHKLPLVFGNGFTSGLRSVYQCLGGRFHSPDRIVCGLRKGLSFFGCRTSHASKLLLASISSFNPVRYKQFMQVRSGTSFKNIGYSTNTNTRVKQIYSSLHVNNRGVVIGDHSGPFDYSMDRACSNPVLFGNIFNGHAGLIVRNHCTVFGKMRVPFCINSVSFQNRVNRLYGAIKPIGNRLYTFASSIKNCHLFKVRRKPHFTLFSNVSDVNATPFEVPHNDVTRDAKLACEIVSGKSGKVFADKIIEYGISEFHGHVYNLQTESNWYVAQGIVSHNCRSIAIPEMKSFRELGLDIDDMPPAVRASQNGPVRADITMSEWMRTQGKEDIEAMLGKTRAKLFLDGKLDIQKFATSKGEVYTLDELKAKNAAAFAKAFGTRHIK